MNWSGVDAVCVQCPLGSSSFSASYAVCRASDVQITTAHIEVAGILERLAAGHAIEALITDSRGLSREAIAVAPPWRLKHSPGRPHPEPAWLVIGEQLLSYSVQASYRSLVSWCE